MVLKCEYRKLSNYLLRLSNNCILTSFIIGLITGGIISFTSECDMFYCIDYINTDKVILGVKTFSQESNYCSVLYDNNRTNECTLTSNYTYWQNNIIFDTCNYTVSKTFTEQNNAYKYAQMNYVVGSTMQVSYYKNLPQICHSYSYQTKNLLNAGITFFCVSMILIMAILIINYKCYFYNNTNKDEQQSLIYYNKMDSVVIS